MVRGWGRGVVTELIFLGGEGDAAVRHLVAARDLALGLVHGLVARATLASTAAPVILARGPLLAEQPVVTSLANRPRPTAITARRDGVAGALVGLTALGCVATELSTAGVGGALEVLPLLSGVADLAVETIAALEARFTAPCTVLRAGLRGLARVAYIVAARAAGRADDLTLADRVDAAVAGLEELTEHRAGARRGARP